jgi:hypothetical protein
VIVIALGAIKYRRANLYFQFAHGDTDRGLSAKDLLGRLVHATLLDDRDEHFQLH